MSGKRVLRKHNPQLILIILIVILLIAIGGVLLFRSMFDKPDIPAEKPDNNTHQTTGGPAGNSSATQSGPTGNSSGNTGSEPVRSNARKDFFTILVSGVDDGNGGADTNILVGFDVTSGAIHCVSIPRDSGFYVNGDIHKINYAYRKGRMELLASSISDGLGIPIDYTVEVNLKGFVQLVDAIGGVEFNVPINMDYDDPYQDLSIHITKGLQKLNGQNALNVVRFRHNNDGTGYGNEDLGRIQTQQAFLKTVFKQTLRLENANKISEFVRIFNKNVKTDLSMGNLAWLGKEAISIGLDNITFSTLPGEWSGSLSLYLLDHDSVLQLVNSSLNPYMDDRIAEDLHLVGG